MKNYTVRRVSLPAGEMTPITLDCDCNYFSLKSASGNPLKVGSDPDDDAQQDILPANAQEACVVAWRPEWGERYRFPQGVPLLYAGPVGGTDEEAILKLVR